MDYENVGWRPERKIVGAATAVVILFALQLVADLAGVAVEVPPGLEGALAVIVAYWVRNPRVDE